MTTTIRARTARVPHLCEGCHGIAPTIAPGHRYLLHTSFLDGLTDTSTGPWSINECVACVCKRDDTAGLLAADACSTFCCGDVPCARPFKHDGDHSCRRCFSDRSTT